LEDNIMTLVDDTWERDSQNTAPDATLSPHPLDRQGGNRNGRFAYNHNTPYFESKDIIAGVFAIAMLILPLTAAATGW
jgi:hypothetical protein